MSLKETLTAERINQAFEKTVQEISFTTGNLAIITEEHYDKFKAFFYDGCLQDEPLCKSMGVSLNQTMFDLLMHCVVQGFSLMLLHPESGDIMGIRVMGIGTADSSLPIENEKDPQMKTVLEFGQYCNTRACFYDRYKTKEALTFWGLVVAKKYRKKGIATRLMEAALCFINNLGVSPLFVKGETSSNYSAKIYDKLEFELINEVQYSDYIIDGKQAICNTGEHTSVKSYGKKL